MFGTAGNRFWRGVREPWELLARMRQHQPLWSRYWRTVLMQAALALVAGLAVFWVGKQGAEAWNDAFGPDEVPEATAPVASGTGSTAGKAPASGAEAGRTDTAGSPAQRVSPAGEPSGSRPPAKVGESRRTATHPPPPSPPPVAAPPPPAPPVTGKTGPSASREETKSDEEKDSDDDEKDEEASGDDERVESDLEAKIAELQKAPPEERGKRTAELVAAAVQKAQKEAARGQRRAKKGPGGDTAEELKEDREGVTEKIGDLTTAAEALAQESPGNAGKARRARRSLERELNEVEKDARKLEAKGAAPLTDAEKAKLVRARTALQIARRHERGFAGRLGAVLALLAAIWAALATAQTGVLALTRDFHDVLARELCLLVHVAPEDPPMRPKIRLDLPWVRRKATRRAWGFLGFLPGVALIWFVTRFLPLREVVTTVLTAVWAAYWWMVMTAGQSARAWTPPATTPRPWYLRAWFGLTDRVSPIRWVLGWWGRLWERLAKRFYGPSERVEEQSLEFAGLALSRALTLIPVVKLLVRPLFSVSAAHLLVEHASTARLPIPVTAIEVADAAAHAPDSEARAHSGVASQALERP